MFLRTFQGGGQLYTASKNKGLRDFEHSMSTSAIVTILYLILLNLLQNAAAILLQNLANVLQNVPGFSLQNATVITKCDVYHKMRRYTY